MRRLSLVLSTLALVVLGLLALAPVAGAAMPPDGTWAWSLPYVPAAGPHAFRAITGGTGFSFYTLGDDWSSEWVVNRVDTAADGEGSTDWTDTRIGPAGSTGAEASFLGTDRAKNLYVVGTDTTHGGDIYLVKYAPGPDLKVLWEKSWDGPKHFADAPHGIAVTASGNVFVAGTMGKAAGYDDAVLLKYDSAGRLKWKYVVSTARYDSFEAIALDSRGNAYVTGQRNGDVGVATMVTVKVDPYGHRVWQRAIAGLGVSYTGDFIKVKGSAVYVAGILYKWADWPVVAKYSLAGKFAWAWTPSSPIDRVAGMTVDAKGRVVLVGTFDTTLGPDALTTAWVDMLAADGRSLTASGMYFADYGATSYPVIFHDVALDGSGNIYLAGEWWTNSGGTEGNALVARIGSPDLPGATFQMEKIWRLDGPASGVDQFWGLLRQSDGFYAVGTEHTGLGWQAIAHRLDP